MKLTVLAVSSSGGSYPVDFSDESGRLTVVCHCQAGQIHQMCKHKLGLLSGDKRLLFDPSESKLLDQVFASPAYPTLKVRLAEYEKALADTEREMAKLKQLEKSLKAVFAYEMAYGKKRPKS